MKTKKCGPDLITLEIDPTDSDTPAMVYRGNLSSTFDCALGTGFIDDQYKMTPAQIAWLETFTDDVEQAFDTARKDNPDYQ